MQACTGSIAKLQLWTKVPVYIDIVYTSELYNNILRFMTRCLPMLRLNYGQNYIRIALEYIPGMAV